LAIHTRTQHPTPPAALDQLITLREPLTQLDNRRCRRQREIITNFNQKIKPTRRARPLTSYAWKDVAD